MSPQNAVSRKALARSTISLTLLALAACSSREPAPPPAAPPAAPRTLGDIERLDAAIDALVPPNAVIEVLASGFEWAEGPVWVPELDSLLFSDVLANRIYLWNPAEGSRLWLEPSGYTGTTPRGGEPGSNGLLLDHNGHLVLCQHGDRRVARLEAPLTAPRAEFTTLADRYDGKRFNSPNDSVLDRSGVLYLTDPPYGLAEGPDDPARELPFSGVYRVALDGSVTLLTDELSRPNGIALSPDERTLYVANSDPERAIWMAYDLHEDGTVGRGRVFFDATAWVAERPGLPDGLAVDAEGHLFATGPGGVLVFAPDGRHLGTIRTTQRTANCVLADAGGTLYMTADSYLLRVRLRRAVEDGG
jgi:gluconolactonase